HVRVPVTRGPGPDGGGLGYRHVPGRGCARARRGRRWTGRAGQRGGRPSPRVRGLARGDGVRPAGAAAADRGREAADRHRRGRAPGAAVAAVLSAGAAAAQIGTAFLRAPEAGTAPAHREALATTRETALTRAFTGRLARGIRNRFMDEHPDAPVAYPEIHFAT